MRYFSLRTVEKLSYIVGVPSLLGFSGYKLYQQSVAEEKDKQEKLKEIEDKYLKQNNKNLVKLDNFRKKVFAIGIEEDFLRPNKKMTEEQKKAIVENALLIRNLIKDVKP